MSISWIIWIRFPDQPTTDTKAFDRPHESGIDRRVGLTERNNCLEMTCSRRSGKDKGRNRDRFLTTKMSPVDGE